MSGSRDLSPAFLGPTRATSPRIAGSNPPRPPLLRGYSQGDISTTAGDLDPGEPRRAQNLARPEVWGGQPWRGIPHTGSRSAARPAHTCKGCRSILRARARKHLYHIVRIVQLWPTKESESRPAALEITRRGGLDPTQPTLEIFAYHRCSNDYQKWISRSPPIPPGGPSLIDRPRSIPNILTERR